MSRAHSVKRRKSRKAAAGFLPEALQAFLARRLVDITAAFLFSAGAFLLLALLSYDHADPSWNSAGAGGPPANLAGYPGAWAADILLQTLGAAALLAGAGFCLWGFRLYRRDRLSPFPLRALALMLAATAGALALAQVPAQGWLVHPYLGGSAGTMILNTLADYAQKTAPFMQREILSGLAAILALACFLYACAVTRDELRAAFGRVRDAALYSILFVWTVIRAFRSWLLHYNDPGSIPGCPSFFSGLSFSLPQRKAPVITKPEAARAPDRRPPAVLPNDGGGGTDDKPEDSIPVVTPQKGADKKQASASGRQQKFALQAGEWELPSLDLLQEAPEEVHAYALDKDALRRNAELLQNVLNDFNIQGEIVSIHPGPVVTLYELEPAPGTKSARVISLSDDIARSMSAISVRCAVVPGRNVIGIELPNKQRQIVYMQELLASRLFEKTSAKLPLALGKDISGQPILADLAKMPHLLVAGTTGSGKSVAVNTMILSLLFRLSPDQCRFIMIDPKMLELSVYDDIPHLLSPVVTEPGKAVVALKWTVQEMENRYRAMSKLGVRNIEGYNARLREASKKGETIMRKVQTGFDADTGKPVHEDQPLDLTELPYIVVVVDEFADLMLVAGKDVENAIQRLAQMARAAGIHLIMATQRPSVDVITGVIKANFPTRISFQVTSKIDSRTILGEGGAEQLLGMGDMLYMAPGGRITRVHGPFVSDSDVEKVVESLKCQSAPSYITDITEGVDTEGSEVMAAMFGEDGGGESQVDDLYDRAVAIVAREGKASTSFIQRHLQIGYNRAARIIEEMEKQGVISPANATGKREILIRDFSDV